MEISMNCLLILTVISAISRVTYGTPQNEPNGEVAQSEPSSISIPLPAQLTSNNPNISAPVQNPVNPMQPPDIQNVTSVAPTPSANQFPMVPMYPNQVPYGMPYPLPGMYYPYNPILGYPQPYGIPFYPQYQQGQPIPILYQEQQMPYQLTGQYPQYQTQFKNPPLPYQIPSPGNVTNTSTFQTVSETAQQASFTPTITSSTGESGSDINSLPPQVKEFMDMIPQILSIHEKQEHLSAPMTHLRPPFGWRKNPKALSLLKQKPDYPSYSVINKYPFSATDTVPPNYYQY